MWLALVTAPAKGPAAGRQRCAPCQACAVLRKSSRRQREGNGAGAHFSPPLRQESARKGPRAHRQNAPRFACLLTTVTLLTSQSARKAKLACLLSVTRPQSQQAGRGFVYSDTVHRAFCVVCGSINGYLAARYPLPSDMHHTHKRELENGHEVSVLVEVPDKEVFSNT